MTADNLRRLFRAHSSVWAAVCRPFDGRLAGEGRISLPGDDDPAWDNGVLTLVFPTLVIGLLLHGFPGLAPNPAPMQTTEQRLIEATLALILKNGGCRGVNLRQIAAKAGCAHTNVYNYFPSLEALFWAALFRALELQIEDTDRQLKKPRKAPSPLRTFLEAQVVFAQKRPGLYRLFWLEPLTGEPPPHVLRRLGEVRKSWIVFIGERLASLRSTTDPAWAGQIIHGYFHGEVCKLVGRRAFVPWSDDDRDRIVNNTLALIDLVATAKKPPAAPGLA